ncbi:hypothetical protein G4G93_32250 [Methylobacterium sp. DB0501]|jgi:hypothetical protein|uniref:hypothetical protein n=1 Tax=Methylobacterium sp. DB0501 TaxID=2709665 RepID=UPI0013EDA976|nr:hypothetical protein [Methylobacterium sp. DB0501]NGM38514.1 hypothetical protein [Methylobacterium sp. DB0501]
MPITVDEAWIPGPDGHSHVRQVYRGGETIGRVHLWQEDEEGDLTREWFTAERMKGALYEPIEGVHPTFDEALDRIVLYSLAQ